MSELWPGRPAVAAGALILALSACFAPAAGDEAPPLVRFLSAVPADSAVLGAPLTFRFIDIHALLADAGLPEPGPEAVVGSSSADLDPSPMLNALMRSQTKIELMAYLVVSIDEWQRTLGFGFAGVEWVADDGWLEWQTTWLGIDAAVEPTLVHAALEARGFTTAEVERSIWSRGRDYRLDFDGDVNDPFGGWLGLSARILVRPRLLVGAPAWELIEPVAAAVDGAGPVLADDPDFAALVGALHGNPLFPGGPLQLMVSSEAIEKRTAARSSLPDGAPEEAVAALQQRIDDGRVPGALPRFALYALADVNTADRPAAVVLLVYRDPDDARRAVEVLARRLAVYRSVDDDRPLAQHRLSLSFETFVEVGLPGGGAVAGIMVQASQYAGLPADHPRQRGMSYAMLVEMYYLRDLIWLAVGE